MVTITTTETLRKTGNSFKVTIRKAIVKKLKAKDKDQLEIIIKKV